MRLIDADAYPCSKCGSVYCITNCDKYWDWFHSTIDAEPVRHGRWVVRCDMHGATEDDGWWREWYATCSECGRTILLNDYICETQAPENALAQYPHCHCGAKMDLEE